MLKAANFNHITVPRLPISHTVQPPHSSVILIRPNYHARQNRIQNNKCDARTQMKHSMLTFTSLHILSPAHHNVVVLFVNDP